MFMKTMAVGPFELVASCVTGGTCVANWRFWKLAAGAIKREAPEGGNPLASCLEQKRSDIVLPCVCECDRAESWVLVTGSKESR